MKKLPIITSAEELEGLVGEIGFLPFFRSGIPGYSLEELTPKDRWFVDGVPGPWEWREAVAAAGKIGYGKLVRNKAAFISPTLLPLLANYRRDGYDYDARFDDGLMKHREKIVMDAVVPAGSMLSPDIRKHCGFGKDGLKGFDGVLTALQMQTYLLVRAFEYKKDRHGNVYGWGIGRYAAPESIFGADLVTARYPQNPQESFSELVGSLSEALELDEAVLRKLLR
jgi:hypothetical protein